VPRGLNAYDEARIQRRLWTPAMLDVPPFAWFDAMDLGTISAASGVDTWRDRSNKGRTIVQSSGVNRPAFQPTGFNGRYPAVVGDGNDAMDAVELEIPYNATTGLSMFAAVQQPTTTGNRGIWGPNASGGALVRWTDNTLNLIRSQQASLLQTSMTFGVGYHIIGAEFKTSLTRAWGNGVSEENANNPAFTSGFYKLFLDNNTDFGSGAVGEVIFIPATLSTKAANNMNGYLAWKWGLPGNLSAGHIYRRRPPMIGD